MNDEWGDNHVIDDRTGFKRKSSEARMQWNGLLVHKDFWEARHPQDTVKPKYDSQSVRNARPETPDVFLAVGEVTKGDL